MRLLWKVTIGMTFAAVAMSGAFAQVNPQESNHQNVLQQSVAGKQSHQRSRAITSDDRLSLLAAALDARVQRESEPDCSHLVHAIYAAAGLHYDYTPSSDLYAGIESFERVKAPLPGDLVVWRGHVGMVIKPSRHIFFSYLSSGPGTDDYEAPYWKHRGPPRFYRYVKKNLPSQKESRPSGPQTSETAIFLPGPTG